MSNTLGQVEQPCDAIEETCSAIEMILEPRETDLGGFKVRRALPSSRLKKVGPWVFFDEMGPAHFPAGEGINVRPHPHIGLATVTYLFDGEILHRDSLGSVQPIVPGDINLMVAGRGIVHSERERPEVTAVDHSAHGLQLWLALPVEDEQCEPAFHHYPSADIPSAQPDGVAVRVMIGSAYGVTSPVRTFAQTLYVEATLNAGQTLTLPDAPERALYVVEGELSASGTPLPQHSLTIFSDEQGITVEARADSRIAIIGGEPFEKRHINWNFVASRRELIAQAREDWEHNRFPLIPGDDRERIPLPQ